MLLNKYDCHIVYEGYTTKILYGYTDPTFLYMCYNTTNCNTHFLCYCQLCARNKCAHQTGYICQIFDRHIWKMFTQVPHMKALQSTISQWTLYTHLIYITEQMWLPHCIVYSNALLLQCTYTLLNHTFKL